MKSEKKLALTPNKYIVRKKKKITKNPKKEDEYETTSMSYFRIMKEIEREQKSQERTKKDSKPTYKNLTEKIYSNNSTKLGNYYNKNQKDLLLYGSKKYDLYNIQRLVKEMGRYKNKVIKKIQENKKNNVCKNYALESCDEKVILTPLAENEKEKNEMENLEKKKFDEAQRCGVVMRRIEYTHLLDNRDTFRNNDINEEEKEMLMLMKDAVDMIERNWIRYKIIKRIKENYISNKNNNKKILSNILDENNDINNNKNKNEIFKNKNQNGKNINQNIKKGINILDKLFKKQFYFEFINKQNEQNKNITIINKSKDRCFLTKIIKPAAAEDTEKNKNKIYLEELQNKYNELNNNYIETKNKLDNLNLQNKQLQLLLEDSKNNYQELNDEYKAKEDEFNNNKKDTDQLLQNINDISNKYNKKMEEYSALNQNYNELLIINNNLKNNYDLLLQNNNTLNNKYKEALEDNNKTNEELNKMKNEYETIIKLNNQKEKKLQEISKNKENIDKEKTELLNSNKLLLDKITNLDGEMNNFKRTKTLQDIETENRIKTLNDNFIKEKNYLQSIVNDKDQEILKHKNTIENYKNKNNELEIIRNELNEIKKAKDENDNELNRIKLDLNEKINKNNEYEKEIVNLKKTMLDNDEINKNKINEYEQEIQKFKNRVDLLENEKEDMKTMAKILENLANENKDKYTKLFYKYKNDIDILNKKNSKLNKDILEFKKIMANNSNNSKDENSQKYNNYLVEINNNYEKKINRLNKIIEELRSRIQTLYLELSDIQRNNIRFNKNADIVIKIKMMLLFIQNSLGKNIIFDKRKFLNILLDKNIVESK